MGVIWDLKTLFRADRLHTEFSTCVYSYKILSLVAQKFVVNLNTFYNTTVSMCAAVTSRLTANKAQRITRGSLNSCAVVEVCPLLVQECGRRNVKRRLWKRRQGWRDYSEKKIWGKRENGYNEPA